MIHRVLIYTLPFLFLCFDVTMTILACSGCPNCTWMDIENDLGENTIVVRGFGGREPRSMAVSVSEFLVGEPDYPYLRLYYAGNGHENASSMGYYSGSCGSGAKYPTADEAYYVMTRQQDGTYRINHIINFPSENPQFIDTSGDTQFYHLTESEFLERIDARPQMPLFMDMEFPPGPNSSPGLILTETDSLYLVPVDARTADDIVFIANDVRKMQIVDTFIGITTSDQIILHEILSGFSWTWDRPEDINCEMIDCLQFSDNGVTMTLQVSADTVRICELALIYPNSNYVSEPTAEQHPCIRDMPNSFYDGAGVSFSQDSDYLAIWHNDQITIYGGFLWLANLMQEQEPRVITSTTIEIPDDPVMASWLAGRGVWSHDNRWLAYSDSEGLWLWDLFTQAPQLLMARNESGQIPYARFFSESGRYIGVSVGDEHFIVDRFSDLRFPDGRIRPDERMMLRHDTVNGLPVPSEQCSLLDGQCMPLNENAPGAVMRDAEWTKDRLRNTWTPCFAVVLSDTELRPAGACYSFRHTGAYSLESFWNQVYINAEPVLDSPISAFSQIPRD